MEGRAALFLNKPNLPVGRYRGVGAEVEQKVSDRLLDGSSVPVPGSFPNQCWRTDEVKGCRIPIR